MQLIAVVPPLVERDVGATDKRERVVVDLAIKRRKCFIDLG
jgi:hypothetical protein